MAKRLTAEEIVELLREPPVRDGALWYSPERRIYRDSTIRALMAAFQIASTLDLRLGVRLILLRLLGERNAVSAIPLLLSCIDDPIQNIRGGAADALLHVAWGHYDSHPERIAKIGNPSVGEILLNRFNGGDTYAQIRTTLALIFGALRYRDAIPALIDALSEPEAALRQCAAEALADLHAGEAIQPLRDAVTRELATGVRDRMENALNRLSDQ